MRQYKYELTLRCGGPPMIYADTQPQSSKAEAKAGLAAQAIAALGLVVQAGPQGEALVADPGPPKKLGYPPAAGAPRKRKRGGRGR